jgi:hypothetical protein
MNGHDLGALDEFTANPAVVASGAGLLRAFPDLETDIQAALTGARAEAEFPAKATFVDASSGFPRWCRRDAPASWMR